MCERRWRETEKEERNIQTVKHTDTYTDVGLLSVLAGCVKYVLAVADNTSKILSLSPSGLLKEELPN